MQNMPDFSQIMGLINTPEGQQLLALIQSADSATVSRAMECARSGDYSAAKLTLSSLLSTPEARELMEKLGR